MKRPSILAGSLLFPPLMAQIRTEVTPELDGTTFKRSIKGRLLFVSVPRHSDRQIQVARRGGDLNSQ